MSVSSSSRTHIVGITVVRRPLQTESSPDETAWLVALRTSYRRRSSAVGWTSSGTVAAAGRKTSSSSMLSCGDGRRKDDGLVGASTLSLPRRLRLRLPDVAPRRRRRRSATAVGGDRTVGGDDVSACGGQTAGWKWRCQRWTARQRPRQTSESSAASCRRNSLNRASVFASILQQ